MGLLDFLCKKNQKIEHIFFGTMTFMDFPKDPSLSYLECRKHFKPSGNNIEIAMDGDLSGATQQQIEFFQTIENNYSKLKETITPLIEDEFRNWQPEFKIRNFSEEFTPVYLRIPKCEVQPFIWEIAFETKHDRNHTITISLSNFRATEILIDG